MEANNNKSAWVIDPVHTKLRFDAKYLMISTVSGWFRELEGSVLSSVDDFSDCEIALTIYTNSLYTGIDERDNHLRSPDFFDARKYPTILFQSSSVSSDSNGMKIKGTLSIKDISQPIEFSAKYHGRVKDPNGNTKAGFELDAVFDRQDFNISWNQFFDKQGILISDQVHIHADVQLLQLN